MKALFLGSSFFKGLYEPVFHYLEQTGYGSIEVYFAHYKPEAIEEVVRKEYPSILLHSEKGFNNKMNIRELIDYVKSRDIQVVFNPNIPIDELSDLMRYLRKELPDVKSIDLLHSCTNFVVINKEYQLKEMNWRGVRSIKLAFQYLLPKLYLYLLQQDVKRRMRLSLKSFDKIITLSPHYVEDYCNLLDLDYSQNQIMAIPNIATVVEPVIPIPEKLKQIVFVGRLSIEKAVHRLLFIWKQSMRSIPDWNLCIVGDGPERKNLETLSIELDLRNVEFVGFQDALPFIDRSSILCLVSNFEGFPTVFTEAMSLGVVPIGFDSFSAIYDMIDHGKNGMIIPCFDYERYADALVALAKDDQMRIRMAEAAKQKVKEYNIPRIASMWKDLFEELKLNH